MLTPEQIQIIDNAVRQVAQSEERNGYVLMQIKNGVLRFIFPAPASCFPDPGKAEAPMNNHDYR